jgi:polyphosphate kinase
MGADLMPRNLDHRIELVACRRSKRGQNEVARAFDVWLSDNAPAWELSSEGRWMQLRPRKGERIKPSQAAFMCAARAGAAAVDRNRSADRIVDRASSGTVRRRRPPRGRELPA